MAFSVGTVFSADQFRAWRFPARAFVDFKEHNHTFDDMFGLVYREVRFSGTNGSDEFSGGSVTPGTFESLGIPPLLGRTLAADDSRPSASPVFVISYSLWTKLFNRRPNILGTTHTLNGTPMTLVGIMPARFQIGGCDLWLPLDITRETFVPGAGIESNEIWTVGHLKAGVSPETASADLQVIASPFQKDDPIYFPPHFKIVVNTFNSEPVGHDFKIGLFALMGADKPEDKCYKKAPNAVAISVLIKASASRHQQQGNRCPREGEKSLAGRHFRRGQEGRQFFSVH
jgi:putative ABC transport system permease protein